MFGQLNQKIVGALLMGVSLIAGAFIYTNFVIPPLSQPAAVAGAGAPARTAITVTDDDQNGIEDWRDTFVTTKAVIIPNGDYELPTTTTGKLGMQFFEDMVQAKYAGPFGRTKEELVGDTVDQLDEQTSQELFDTRDVVIMNTWTDENIRTYTNAMADAITTNNIKGTDNEVNIMYEALTHGKTERLKELDAIVTTYKNTLVDTLLIPVPAPFLKEHLDLVNSYNAIKQDVEAMSVVESDPVVSLLRFKRYQDDSLGLRLSLENLYLSLTPYSHLFNNSDSAILFNNFNPSNSGIQ